MIRLSEQSPLGTGRHRKCYAHPEDAQRCIKIVYHRGDGGDKEIRRELKYYAHLGRRLKDWSGIGNDLSPNRRWLLPCRKICNLVRAKRWPSLRAKLNPAGVVA